MMHSIKFHLIPSANIDIAWQQLEDAGCQLLFSMENEESDKQIVGYLPSNLSAKKLISMHPYISTIEDISLEPIDWEAQWKLNGNHYSEGFIHINLHDYSEWVSDRWPQILRLKPGPGFGDLSHPTTRLVLKLMGDIVRDQHVLDVGCGSGILSFAALAMGARSVTGIDIDEDALEHSRTNSQFNGMENVIDFLIPQAYIQKDNLQAGVILMNMIQSEQVSAWHNLEAIHPKVCFAVTSGILAEAKESYLNQCHHWGWHLLKTAHEEGWEGYIFKMSF